jgi:hypothetical protein
VTFTVAKEFAAMLADEYLSAFVVIFIISFQWAAAPGRTFKNASTAASSGRCWQCGRRE